MAAVGLDVEVGAGFFLAWLKVIANKPKTNINDTKILAVLLITLPYPARFDKNENSA